MFESAIAQAATPSIRDRARAPLRRHAARPIHVVGGFLGSGKTTLLLHLLSYVRGTGARPVVIMNEPAESSVDGRLLSAHDHRGDLTVREPASGCVCCDLSKGLSFAVADLLRTTDGPIFIETTGLAVVERVARAVRRALAPLRGAKASVARSVVAVVDALRFELNRQRSPHLASAVAAAEIVVVNQVDAASPAVVRRLRADVRALNDRATVIETSYGRVAPVAILSAAPARATPSHLRPPNSAMKCRLQCQCFWQIAHDSTGRPP